MAGLTLCAVDWSGARRPQGIWIAVVRDGCLDHSAAARTREDAIAFVRDLPGPVVAGFDFSFSVPAWFARDQGCRIIDDVWDRAARDGERWLAPTAPFWRTRCTVPREQRFRRCEERYPTTKSIFQLVGNGQVGAGSVRGMPLLRDLRAAGFAIWPFDPPGARTALEIYPSALRPLAPPAGPFASADERDAVTSALVMWQHREQFSKLTAATDPVTRLEGGIWAPGSAGPTAWL